MKPSGCLAHPVVNDNAASCHSFVRCVCASVSASRDKEAGFLESSRCIRHLRALQLCTLLLSAALAASLGSWPWYFCAFAQSICLGHALCIGASWVFLWTCYGVPSHERRRKHLFRRWCALETLIKHRSNALAMLSRGGGGAKEKGRKKGAGADENCPQRLKTLIEQCLVKRRPGIAAGSPWGDPPAANRGWRAGCSGRTSAFCRCRRDTARTSPFCARGRRWRSR